VKWQILILSERSRNEMLQQVLEQLRYQMAALPLKKFGDVEVLVHEDETGKLFGKPTGVGEMREYMRKQSTGDYINFIDSDDLIAPDYIESILPLLDGVDYVGFDVKCFTDHEMIGIASHSLAHGKWSQHRLANGRVPEMRFCRDISHLNPMRRELALSLPMSGSVGEDCRWANDLRAKGIVKTEHYISRVLYWYLWRGQKLDSKDANDPWRLQIIEDLRAHIATQS